jgi:hypothetical protein
MPGKYLTFAFAQKHEDFICIGGGHMTAVFCTSTLTYRE